MRSIVGLLAVMSIACAVLVLALQGSPDPVPRPSHRVGVVVKAMNSEHWLAVRAAMARVAQAENVSLVIMAPDNERDYEVQNKMVHDLVESGVDALIVAPCNTEHTADWLPLVQARNIPLVTIDEKIAGVPYVGTDNYHVGEMAAEVFAQELPVNAAVGIVVGSSTQYAHTARLAGFRDYLAAHSSLRLVASPGADMDYRLATRVGEQLLTEHPETAGLFVTSGILTLGVLDATEHLGLAPLVISVDGQSDTIVAMRQGRIGAIIAQDSDDTGRLAMESIVRLLRGEAAVDSYARTTLITPATLDDYERGER